MKLTWCGPCFVPLFRGTFSLVALINEDAGRGGAGRGGGGGELEALYVWRSRV